jgi:hypothetical protein
VILDQTLLVRSVLQNIFDNLRRGQNSVQNRAIAQLAMILEQSAFPDRSIDVARIVLSEELLQVRLSADEIKEALNAAAALVASDELPMRLRVGLSQQIGLHGDVDHADVLLQFLNTLAQRFDEQDAFSFLACFTLFLMRVGPNTQLQNLVRSYKTEESLSHFEKHDGARLRESVMRVLRMIRNANDSA